MYMDRNNDGMIKISDVEMAISGDKYSPVSGVARSAKWFLLIITFKLINNSTFIKLIYYIIYNLSDETGK